MLKLTRRRAFQVVAAAAGLPLLAAGVRAIVPNARFFHWQGEVLGAASELTLWHWDEALARRTILRVRQEIERYERIFSLYRDDSEIAHLNRDGILVRPSTELVSVIDESQKLGTLSGGAFDITVQPLWRAYEEHFWSRRDVSDDIAARAQDVARRLVDFRRVQAGASRIDMPPGMAITLNGIAQGFITDRIADLLRHEGFEQAMVDLGEFRALGSHPENRPWRVALRSGQNIELFRQRAGGLGRLRHGVRAERTLSPHLRSGDRRERESAARSCRDRAARDDRGCARDGDLCDGRGAGNSNCWRTIPARVPS